MQSRVFVAVLCLSQHGSTAANLQATNPLLWAGHAGDVDCCPACSSRHRQEMKWGGCFRKKVENGGFVNKKWKWGCFVKKVDISSMQGALCTVSVFLILHFTYLGGAYAPPLSMGLSRGM